MLSNCGAVEDYWESLGQQGRSNQLLKEIRPEYPLEGPKLQLKFQYFGHMMGRADSLEKTLMLRKFEGRRRREWQKGTRFHTPQLKIPHGTTKTWHGQINKQIFLKEYFKKGIMLQYGYWYWIQKVEERWKDASFIITIQLVSNKN